MSISRKKKVININKDILSLFDAARLMDTTKEIITSYIRNNK